MIRSFRHRGLKEPWLKGTTRHLNEQFNERALRRLDALDGAQKPEDMNVPGFDFHKLRGKPTRYTVHVSGPWCITFEWDQGEAVRVDFEQYH